MMKYLLILIGIVICAAVFAAGCTQPGVPTPTPTATPTVTPQPSEVPTTVKLAQNATLGIYLVDENIVVNPPLTPAEFGTITRADGTKQTTYRGWPLYHYSGDKGVGETNGENFIDLWWVVKPDYSVVIMRNNEVGTYLADPAGRTLYTLSRDTPGVSTCIGNCSQIWPIFYVEPPVVAPSLIPSSDFARITRTDGGFQTTYQGKPLYWYSGDTKPGQTNGEGFNNIWTVAMVAGTPPPPTPTTVATTVPTTTPTTQSSSSGYYY
jgi:predicted lipoprotein with Yx(FWY)xxD motif